MSTWKAIRCLLVAALCVAGVPIPAARAGGGQAPPGPREATAELKNDPRLQARVTASFKKPRVDDLILCLEKATGLKYATNGMVETTLESFGSVSFRNTPAWIVMQELARSGAVRGRWEKGSDGYTLIGSLGTEAQAARVASLQKPAQPELLTERPRQTSHQFWIFLLVITAPVAGLGVFVAARRLRGRVTA